MATRLPSFLIAASIVASFAYVGCNRDVPTIALQFPVGFRGVVILKWQQSRGVTLKHAGRILRIVIPQSGVVLLAERNPMLNWCVETSEVADGSPLQRADENEKDRTGIYLWDMGVNANGTESWYVVGKVEDLLGVRERKLGVPPMPAAYTQ